MDEPTGDLVTIGRVVKAHGIRGEVVVEPLSDLPERFEPGAEVLLGGTPATIASTRAHQGRLLIRFEGIADRSAAELVRGRVLEAPPVELDGSDHYFVHELVGMTVVNERGTVLGVVSSLIELPGSAGYDLLEVTRDDGSTWLLPAVDDYVEVESVEGDEADAGDAARGGERRERLRLVDPPAGLVEGEPDVVRSEEDRR